MKLLVGLGNPGKEYFGTRHNLGFQLIHRLSNLYDIRVEDYRHRALLGTGRIAGEKVMLAQPLTYMNRSGEAVQEILCYYKINPRDMLVIYDDLDLELGQLRIRPRGSAGTHNGMDSVIKSLGTREIPRLRLGTGGPPEGVPMVDFVLSPFGEDELPLVDEMLQTGAAAVKTIIRAGIQEAMNHFNRKQDKGQQDIE
ncbi:MAG: aminoacyl-tRNA hydrolase [Halanaerobium sp.]|nr:aminoacyl-tRNA hydrolase [Halanaerobium sp.]